jgi:hypothetical protein
MRRFRLSAPLVAVVVAAAVAGGLHASGARAAPVATLAFAPTAVEAQTDDAMITVDIVTGDVTDLAAFEFAVTYDPRVVDLTGVAPSGFLGLTGREVDCLVSGDWPTDDPAVNVITFGCNSVGLIEGGAGVHGPSGDGALATLTFAPLAEGATDLAFIGIDDGYRIDAQRMGHTSMQSVEVCDPGCEEVHLDLAASDGHITVVSPDKDGDGVLNIDDNCPDVANADQTNTDGAGPGGDRLGDACDDDDDNDGIQDAAEAAGCNGSGSLDPLRADTDGDRVLDGAECALGSNPADTGSKPAWRTAASDTDADGLPDAIEVTVGSDPNRWDSDADGVADGIEYRGYATSPVVQDADGDGCADGQEIADVNQEGAVDGADLAVVGEQFGTGDSTADVNRDGIVNSLDLMLVARLTGSCAPMPD